MRLRYTGTTSGVWKLAANWYDLDTGLTATHYPGDTLGRNDDVYIDTKLSDGAVSCAGVTNLADDLNSLYVGGTYNGSVGSAESPVEVSVLVGDCCIDATQAGAIFLSGDARTGIRNFVMQNGQVALFGRLGSLYLLKASTLELASAATIETRLWISYMTNPTSDLVLTIPSNITLPSDIDMNGGTVMCNAEVTELRVSNGIWRQQNAVMNLFQTGGTFQWMDGDIDSAYVSGQGTMFDGSESTQERMLTYGFCGRGATMKLNPTSNNIIVDGYVKNLGGTVEWSTGTKLKPVA